MVELIHSAQRAGITAKFVLFDSWFSAPKTILELKKQEHLDTIAMMKKSKTKYRYPAVMPLTPAKQVFVLRR